MIGWKKKISASAAFTVVELLIVIIVIAVLASLVTVGYSAVQRNANDASVKSDLQKIDDAFKQYALDNQGQYPDTSAKVSTTGVKLNGGSYATNTKANVYICVNASRTEYGVVAISKSGNAFKMLSEQGVSAYTGIVAWSTTNANYASTCTDLGGYFPTDDSLTGMLDKKWRTWTGVQGAVPDIANLIPNPSFEVDASNVNYGDASSEFTQSTDWASNGTTSLLSYGNDISVYETYLNLGGGPGGMRLGMAAGKTYTISTGFYMPNEQTGTLSADARKILVKYRVGAGAYQTFYSSAADNIEGEARLSLSFTLPANTTEAWIVLYNGAAGENGDVYWDSMMLTEGSTLYDYRDGNFDEWAWTGTPGLSTSRGLSPNL